MLALKSIPKNMLYRAVAANLTNLRLLSDSSPYLMDRIKINLIVKHKSEYPYYMAPVKNIRPDQFHHENKTSGSFA